MLFYVSLFLFCVVFSAIVLWLYRSMAEVGKAVYRSFLSSSRGKVAREEHQEGFNSPLAASPTPRGWSGNSHPRRTSPTRQPVAKFAVSAPWGWPGNSSNTEERTRRVSDDVALSANASRTSFVSSGRSTRNTAKEDKPVVGWPYRDERSIFEGGQYNVTRKPKTKKIRMSKNKNSKPWGW